MNKRGQTYLDQPKNLIPDLKDKRILKKGELFQKTSSSVVIILGVIVILMTANFNLTGMAIGNNAVKPANPVLNLIVILWGFLLLITGIWMWFKK